ncbi:MAG: bi-domain-containing oxidoreductase, partial [Gemmatimonadetes bacterium]|nr:bi-domain-containing oxidoreductase [Gemmatimonadota bacterium]
MKQLLQDVRSGSLKVLDVPAPLLRPGGIVVRTRYSVISAGTERMKLEFGRKSLIRKALDRPDQVRQVLETVGREGIASTYRKVRSRLTGLSPLGYSLSGVVEEVAEEVPDFRVGDLVACAGAGYASHAERVWVPRNLAVGVPPDVPLEAAAFATLGAISLHGVHQAGVRLGESVAVIGLGLLGQLTVQVLTAAGVRSVGIDMDPDRVALVERSGALGMVREDQVVAKVEAFTGGLGVDAVIITAATQSDDPMRLAARLARDRGRVVVVGAVGMTVPRALYYEKELELRLSRSYGPGRYDRSYEEKGQDYPAGYVRWTERRNLAEFLRLLSSGDVVVGPLITHRFAFADAPQAYELLGQRSAGALGVVLEYPEERRLEAPRIPLERGMRRPLRSGRVRLGLIGAGGYATATLLPLLRRLGAEPQGVATAGGVSARSAGETHGFRYLASSAEQLLADPEIDAVVIATRHQDHARLAAQALRAGKPVFVEKPLALDEESLR